MRPLQSPIFAATALLLISACGGGGGSPTTSMPAPPSSGQMPTVDTAFSVNPSTSQNAAEQAATATPAFGSVTQSSNVNVSGVSTDAAQVTVNSNNRITLRVRRRDGSRFSLNTVDHLVAASDVVTSPVTGRSWNEGLLFDYDANSFTVMRGAIDYSSTDVTDYLAGGYWMHARGNLSAGTVSAIEVGAFVDGPEISGPASVPLSGTATYNGIAAGLYASRYGTDVPGEQPGTIELGEYSGSFRAVANFGTGSISASVSNIVVDAVVAEPDGTVYTGYGASPTTLNLGSTSINSDGTFTGTNVALSDPRFSFASNTGSWGGRFSTVDDATGVPRAVAGTHGGDATTTGGTEVTFIGAHFGATPSF